MMSEATKEGDTGIERWGGHGGATRKHQRKAERAQKRRENEQLRRLTTLDNRTAFKTGWEKETGHETEQQSKSHWVEVKSPWVEVPKVESFTNEEELESEELGDEAKWEKTQRRIYDDIIYTDKDDSVRHHEPKKKLNRSPIQMEYSPLVRLDAPIPTRATHSIPDSGVRNELDLRCLEDEKYLEALDYDIKGIQSRHTFSLGPSSSKKVVEYCRQVKQQRERDDRSNPNDESSYVDNAIRCSHASTSTDPCRRIQVYYPDANNYKREEALFRQKILQPIRNAMYSRFLNLHDAKSNFMCSISVGLDAAIHLRDDEFNFSRVLCMTTMCHSRLVNGLKTHFPSFLGVREISFTERKYAQWKVKDVGISQSLLYSDTPAYEVIFKSSQDGLAFCQKFAVHERFQLVMKYPTSLDNCSNPTSEFQSLVLKWYPFSSERRTDIYLKNSEDCGYAEQILNGHSIHVGMDKFYKYNKGNRRMELYRNDSSMSFDSLIMERVLRQVLSPNGIELEKIVFRRKNIRPHNDKLIRDLIQQRIGRAAVNAKVWKDQDYTPGADQEWFAYIHGNEEKLGWQLELPPETRRADHTTPDYQRKATVIFDDANVGKAVADYLMRLTPDRKIFSLAKMDDQGVRFYAIYTFRFDCPKPLRAVCGAALNAIDDQAREESNYAVQKWVRLRDYKYEDVIVVEGWPKEDVAKTAALVRDVLRGRVVAYADDQSDTSSGRLLYGCGLQYVNHLQKTHHEKVAMTVDRLNQEIIMWGDEATMNTIEDELRAYAKNSNAYMLEKVHITIGSPRFLPIFGEVLVFNTVQRISEAVGGATIRFKHPMSLEFTGSVKQYEDLQKLLDQTHQKTLDIVRKNGYGNDVVPFISTDCSVCLLEAVGPFSLELCGHTYCLQCIAEMIRTRIKEKKVPITCCAKDCDELIALEDILNLMFDDNSNKYPDFWKKRLQPILKMCSEAAVTTRRDMSFCTRPDCSAVISLTGKRLGEFYECTCCEMQMCVGCFNPPHPGKTCDDEAALRGSVDLSLKEWVNANPENEVKHCPTDNCKAVIEKERGCNHMQCNMCKVHFCWLCLFTGETDKEIYAHMGDHHGGTGGEWAFLDQQQGPQAFDVPPGFEHMANRGAMVIIDDQPVFLEEDAEW